ncbi:UDP-N-acetylenolpyruvoylglucosamine reductase [Siphonobacter sp. SORGH_AS_0500]|uniref:UDP-N-acetylmuramate dehydrogenase n=1 Tax=Siphonobacter sp. SORGH_AS_0500 TaxID=1864824 RepID=UPI000CBA34A7|nr:UDP-N-acetylmuramate dehydrogenase [Siphonobacter sp. SORGH_AS_0500]PKK36130.1 UDP-N-acetylenolpyruvoylglucosamine reductase [Siphonobacter sp. SORGH_AS_0500]
MHIQEYISLKPYTTFGIEATARYFVEVNSLESLRQVLAEPAFAATEKLILGGGSNVLLTKDFDGLVIRMAITGISVSAEDELYTYVRAGAGVVWHELVLESLEKGLSGLENLSLIPGSVGASPMQNIGAYGVEIKDVFHSLEAIDRQTGELRIFSHQECQFGYRESVFKHELKNQFVIVAVTFKLSKTPHYQISYGDIQKTLEARGVTELSSKAISEAVIEIRRSKLPDPAELGNAGSFFKNPEIPAGQYEALKSRFPNIPGYLTTPGQIKVPAGWLIEQAGWKGYREGSVGVHAKQALVLVNYGQGTGPEIKALSEKVQASVLEKYGIQLSAEVNFI